MTTPLIAQRLQQQTQAWNQKQGTNLTVQQYVSRMSMLTPATRQKLINIYYEATKSTVSPATQDIIQTRLAEQTAAWNKKHGTNYTIQEYLDMLSKGDGVAITPKTKQILTDIEERPTTPTTTPTVLEPKKDKIEPPKIKITDRSWITLPVTKTELATIAKAEAKGQCVGAMKAYYTVKTYAIMLKGGGQIYVEALSNKGAKQKAVDAGYKVAWVTSRASTWVPTEGEDVKTKVEGQDWVNEYLKGKDFWKDDYLVEGGYDLVKMLDDSLTTGATLSPNDLRELFGDEAVKVAYKYLGQYREVVTTTLKGEKLSDFEGRLYGSGNQFLIEAWESGADLQGKVDKYNDAVNEYNDVVAIIQAWEGYSRDQLERFAAYTWQDESIKWSAKYYLSDAFVNRYATAIQPSTISDTDYNKIKPYINPVGFDSKQFYNDFKGDFSMIDLVNRFTLASIGDVGKQKIESGEWTLLPYGEIIETKTLDNLPPTTRNIMEISGVRGYEDYQEKVLTDNKAEGLLKNTADALLAQTTSLGFDVKNFALLEAQHIFPDVKEGDSKVIKYLLTPQLYKGYGVIGLIGELVTGGGLTFSAQEAEEITNRNRAVRSLIQDTYNQADMAAQEWIASRPSLQPVYAEGFLDSVSANPQVLKDPLLWTETMAATIPYTVGTGIIVAGGALGGPAGVAISIPIAFGITMSVEGNDIYKDALQHGATPEKAFELANVYGAISASIETVGDTIFVGTLGFARGAIASSLGRNIAREVVKRAAKKYGWKTLTGKMVLDFVNQGGQEFGQQVVHNAAIKTIDENQYLLEGSANAFVTGVIGTAPFVMIPAGGQAVKLITANRAGEARAGIVTGTQAITPQTQVEILDKILEPVSGMTVKVMDAQLKHLKDAESTEGIIGAIKLKGKFVYEAGKKVVKDLFVMRKATNSVIIAYNEMLGKIAGYAHRQLELKQVQKALSDAGLAKSGNVIVKDKSTGKQYTLNAYLGENPKLFELYEEEGYEVLMSKLKKDKDISIGFVGKLGIVEKLKDEEQRLEKELKKLKNPMVESVEKYRDAYLASPREFGDMEELKDEVKEMPKTIVMDIDNITSQLFGTRDALQIAKDIKELEGQITVIEEEIKKGMILEQVVGYVRLVSTLRAQIGDLIGELRIRYIAEGEEIKYKGKRLAMEVLSLQQRLAKAVAGLENFRRSALNYDVYRKGELAGEAGIVKLERDTFEAIQKTTEAIYGKESYGMALSQLNDSLIALVAMMKGLSKSQRRVVRASFKIYDGIKKENREQVDAGVEDIEKEVEKVEDKELQTRASHPLFLLKTLATQDIAGRFADKGGFRVVEVTDNFEYLEVDDVQDIQRQAIRREAERIVKMRYEKLVRPIPSSIQDRSASDFMEYLEKIYDKEYFQVVHDGIYEDIHDFLDVEREVARIWGEVARQEEMQRRETDIEKNEREQDLLDKFKDDVDDKTRRDIDKRDGGLAGDIKDKKRELKVATEVKLAVPEKQLEQEELEKLRDIKLKRLKEEVETDKLRKLKSEEKAAEKIKKAVREIEKEKRESAFPGIEPSRKIGEEGWTVFDSRTLTTYIINTDGSITKVDPVTKTRTTTKLSPAIEVSPAIRTAVKEALETQLQSQTQALTKTQAQQAVQTATRTALQTAPQTKTETQTQTETETETETNTRTITNLVTQVTVHQIKILVPPILVDLGGGKKGYKIPVGSITWKQGLFWKYIPPPWRQEKPITLKHPPVGAKFIGAKTPEQTIQMIGKSKAKVPKSASIDLGVVDILIDNYGKDISFTGHGLETVVGSSIAGATKGMSIPASGIMKVKRSKHSAHRKKKELVPSASVG